MHDPSGESAPYLAIMFEDIAAGKEIFPARRSLRSGGIGSEVSTNTRRFHFDHRSRIKRMTPAPGSPHLGQFKKEMAKHQRYSIIPLSPKGERYFDLAIGKKEVLFRQSLEITGNDLDAVVFPEHCFDGEKSVH